MARRRALSIRFTATWRLRDVAADELEVLQTVVAEALLAGDVLAVLGSVLVVLALVLADQAGLDVEEVGYADQPAVEVEDLAVAQR